MLRCATEDNRKLALLAPTRNNYGMAEPIPLRMNDVAMRRIIRDLAKDSVNVFIGEHARKRMRKRHITRPQVEKCLLKGLISEPAHRDAHGDWACTLHYQWAGDDVCVAVALKSDGNGSWIAVVTVF